MHFYVNKSYHQIRIKTISKSRNNRRFINGYTRRIDQSRKIIFRSRHDHPIFEKIFNRVTFRSLQSEFFQRPDCHACLKWRRSLRGCTIGEWAGLTETPPKMEVRSAQSHSGPAHPYVLYIVGGATPTPAHQTKSYLIALIPVQKCNRVRIVAGGLVHRGHRFHIY